MYKLLLAVIGLLIFSPANGQQKQIDSLLNLLNKPQHDTVKAKLYNDIGHYYVDNNNSLAIQYLLKAIDIRKKYNLPLKLANNYYSVAYCFRQKSDYARSLDYYLKSVTIYVQLKDTGRLFNAYLSVGNVYMDDNDFTKSKEYLNIAEALTRHSKNEGDLATVLDEKGLVFDHLAQYDSALFYHQKAYNISIGKGDDYSTISFLSNLGLTYKHKHNAAKAMECFNVAMALVNKDKMPADIKSNLYNNIASAYADERNYTAARQNFDTSILLAKSVSVMDIVLEDYRNLADMYSGVNDYKQEAFYLKKYYTLKDSLYSSDTKNQLTQLESNFRIGQKNEQIAEQQQEVTKQTGQRNSFLIIAAAAALLLVISIIFYSRSAKTNTLLLQKNTQIHEQNDKLEHTLTDLKSAQAQLIQSEKMASLGELTAGIAHEIQNPLNFVNNFSEVNIDMLEELKAESKKPKAEKDEQLEAELIGDLLANERKINHHGKRADSIVKGMLEHSRMSTGQKEITDLNKLADEYLRLAYHGLRAKDKSFNAELITNFDKNLPPVNIVPQDIGRVLLNLFNNAFYAVNQKAKTAGTGYKPEVSVSTVMKKGQLVITVNDNGVGIPDANREKIMQPFFTTKPTGEGTGLGMSLSYDIVVKGHGGSISVTSKEGEGSAFIVTIPVI
jgi:two-component system NtrC family sensor kinase